MRFLLWPAILCALALSACNKKYTCDCSGFSKKGELVRYQEDYELARKKDSETICDSARRDFLVTRPDLSSVTCELR